MIFKHKRPPLYLSLAFMAAHSVMAQTSPVPVPLPPTQLPLLNNSIPDPTRPPIRILTGEKVTLNFSNADIESVSRAMAAITGKSIAVDPRVKGNMSLATDKPLPIKEAMGLFLSTLRFHGFAVAESGGVYKVIPEADAKTQSGKVETRAPESYGGQIITEVLHLDNESANALVPILRPLISANNTISASPGNNALIITDYADNIRRISKIVANLDQPSGSDVEIIPLTHAVATDAVNILSKMIEGSSGAPTGTPEASGAKTSLLADSRSNSIIVKATSPARMSLARMLINKLDAAPTGSNGEAGNIYVVYLKNADATKLAVTLRAAISGNGASGSPSVQPTPTSTPTVSNNTALSSTASGPTLGGFTTTQNSTGGQIQADASTNSLIITAAEPTYRQLRAVIEKLDARRAQVYVESLIAEVSDSKTSSLGIQWQAGLGSSVSNNVGVLGTNFGSGGNNIFTLSTQTSSAPVAPSPGFNLGIAHNYGGTFVLGFLAQFLQQNADANILSTPNLLTLDNEEAKIVIGQNVPFVTGQYTSNNSGGSGSVNPFQTIERKDVGLTLRVKPQISQDGTVKLVVFQEVSSVDNTATNAAGIVTNKRSIESTVLVDDGGIVVLGGLLQDQYNGGQNKVPGVGDIPFVGGLFRNENRSRAKTNLMVFLRPVILRDKESSNALAESQYQNMRGAQGASKPAQTFGFVQKDNATLPELHPKNDSTDIVK